MAVQFDAGRQTVGNRPMQDGAAHKRLSKMAGDTFASSGSSLVIPGVPVGETLPVKVKAGFTVEGTAIIARMTERSAKFVISVRDSVFGHKIEKDVTVSIDRRNDGTYLIRQTEAGLTKQKPAVVATMTKDGPSKKFTMPDTKHGGYTSVTVTDMGDGAIRLRGEDFTADINRNF